MASSVFSRLFAREPGRTLAAEVHHAGALSTLHAQCFARGWDGAEFASLLADPAVLGDVLVGGVDDTVLGFAVSRIAADEAELLSICVSEAVRGLGEGQRLLAQHLIELAARGVRDVFLEVQSGNLAALALYRRFEFEVVAQRPGYYTSTDGSRLTAIVMRKALDGVRR